MARTERVRVAAPLAAFAAGFGTELERLGYSRFTADAQLQLMATAKAEGVTGTRRGRVSAPTQCLCRRRERGIWRRGFSSFTAGLSYHAGARADIEPPVDRLLAGGRAVPARVHRAAAERARGKRRRS